MNLQQTTISRRGFLQGTATAVAAGCLAGVPGAEAGAAEPPGDARGAQRLSLERLKGFEALRYGMFISYDVQAFVPYNLHKAPEDKRRVPASVYAPDKLDVKQWISVARDAGMKYAVLTAKRHPGFCLWPSQHTDFTVANSGNKTDVVAKYVKACGQCGVQPGLYYPSVDVYHLGGRPANTDWKYTTSLYQTFMTDQLTELLGNYGPIAEVWIDIPVVLGPGYRTFLYQHIAGLQPDAVIMMNAGIQDGTDTEALVPKIWPSDLIAIERRVPPETGHEKWRTIGGKRYYLPGELCDSIMEKSWYWVEGERPRADEDLAAQFEICRERGVNYLLDAPPDNHGLIPPATIEALQRLRRNAKL